MKLNIKAQVIIRDKNGKVIKTINKTLHSYVKAMIDLLYIYMSATGFSIKDTGNVNRDVAVNAIALKIVAGVGDATYGIVVGTGNGAVVLTDYKLQSQIAQGVGAGQLQHGVTSVIAPSTVGSTRQFTATRTFTNGSGSAISIKEVGLYCQGYALGNRFFCIERSLLNFDIANGESGTVTYTISCTV